MHWYTCTLLLEAAAGQCRDVGGVGTADAAPSQDAAAAAGGAAPSQQPPASAEAAGADAGAADAPADAASGQPAGGVQQKKEGRPRVPLADPITLEQLEAVRPGCCVAILRCCHPK